MKKNLLFLLLTSYTFAQFTIKKTNGTDFTNNEIVEFTSHSSNESELGFTVHNTSSDNMNFKVRCDALVNSDGTNFQLCWAFECLPNVSLNSIYPDFDYAINAGQNTVGFGDSFKNFSAGDGTNYPMDFTFRFFATNITTGSTVGSPFFITYRYQGPLSIDSKDILADMGVKVLNTSVDNYVGLQINKTTNLELYNLQGQQILTKTLNNDYQLMMNDFQQGIYLLRFSNQEGLNHTIKVIKK